jgi:hypothetical protein
MHVPHKYKQLKSPPSPREKGSQTQLLEAYQASHLHALIAQQGKQNNYENLSQINPNSPLIADERKLFEIMRLAKLRGQVQGLLERQNNMLGEQQSKLAAYGKHRVDPDLERVVKPMVASLQAELTDCKRKQHSQLLEQLKTRETLRDEPNKQLLEKIHLKEHGKEIDALLSSDQPSVDITPEMRDVMNQAFIQAMMEDQQTSLTNQDQKKCTDTITSQMLVNNASRGQQKVMDQNNSRDLVREQVQELFLQQQLLKSQLELQSEMLNGILGKIQNQQPEKPLSLIDLQHYADTQTIMARELEHLHQRQYLQQWHQEQVTLCQRNKQVTIPPSSLFEHSESVELSAAAIAYIPRQLTQHYEKRSLATSHPYRNSQTPSIETIQPALKANMVFDDPSGGMSYILPIEGNIIIQVPRSFIKHVDQEQGLVGSEKLIKEQRELQKIIPIGAVITGSMVVGQRARLEVSALPSGRNRSPSRSR